MLNDKELEVLRTVKTAPSSLRLSVHKRYLKQHSHDRVEPSHPEARYFTRKNKRALIKILLNLIET